jgi:DnaJ-class molecular chaperone
MDPCTCCDGSGWLDPRDLPDGMAWLSWCDHCLGAGLVGCTTCGGEGVVADPVPCPAHRVRAVHAG